MEQYVSLEIVLHDFSWKKPGQCSLQWVDQNANDYRNDLLQILDMYLEGNLFLKTPTRRGKIFNVRIQSKVSKQCSYGSHASTTNITMHIVRIQLVRKRNLQSSIHFLQSPY